MVHPFAADRAVVIVAHPDDETLWCGGLILEHPDTEWHVVGLCRGDDPDRAPRFDAAMTYLGAAGTLGTLDDGPDQHPLPPAAVASTILTLCPPRAFDLALTHGPLGEYTRHRRHEECGRAAVDLWASGQLRAPAFWMFAYEDGGRAYPPRPRRDADRRFALAEHTCARKRHLIERVYGFAPTSWEAEAVTDVEGFWCFDTASDAVQRIRAVGSVS
jgi:LmbE family N-acetylglucosaminyl deacetylase